VILRADSFGRVADNKGLDLEVLLIAGMMHVAGCLVPVPDSDRNDFVSEHQSERFEGLWEPAFCVALVESGRDRAG